MNTHYEDQILPLLKQSWHEFIYLLKRALKELLALPWPRLLLVCLGLALFISILPLALTLFCVFLLGKLIMLCVGMNVRKTRRQPPQILPPGD